MVDLYGIGCSTADRIGDPAGVRKGPGWSEVIDQGNRVGVGSRIEMMAGLKKDMKKKVGDGITFEELRRAKYDFALGDDSRICKH